MSEVVMTVTIFHTLAAVTIFGVAVVGVLQAIQRRD